MIDTRTYRGADLGSDYNLVIAKIKLKLCRVAKSIGTREKWDVNKLRNPENREEFVFGVKRQVQLSCRRKGRKW